MFKLIKSPLIIFCTLALFCQPGFSGVVEILNNKCSSCHNPGQGSILDLSSTSEAGLIQALAGRALNHCGLYVDLLVPGRPYESAFYGRISGGCQMRPNMAITGGLTNNEIAEIRDWIGFLNTAPTISNIASSIIIAPIPTKQ